MVYILHLYVIYFLHFPLIRIPVSDWGVEDLEASRTEVSDKEPGKVISKLNLNRDKQEGLRVALRNISLQIQIWRVEKKKIPVFSGPKGKAVA